MINQIKKALNNNVDVTDYLIKEVTTKSYQQFYVRQKLEMERNTSITEYFVTIYHEFEENNNKYLGSSNFVISHKLSKKELTEKINETIISCKLVKNPYYKLVNHTTKKTFGKKGTIENPMEALNNCANIYFSNTSDIYQINALELFYTNTYTRLVSSKGFDLKKNIDSIFVEAIPSSYKDEKFEVYKSYSYNKFDYDQIEKDAKDAIDSVKYRSEAKAYTGPKNINITLQGIDLEELFMNVVHDFNYSTLYKKMNQKNINDLYSLNPSKDKLSIKLSSGSKSNGFDDDGVILHDVDIIKDNVVTNFYGSNMFASYLGINPSGNLKQINLLKGKHSTQSLLNKNTLQIISLSGIQVDTYSDYIGGEIRLALYHDGKNIVPVTGISFSSKLSDCMNNLELSKEMNNTENYSGPKYIKMFNVDIL